MHVHPDIAGLRRKGASQPSLDAALARWRALPATAELLQALAAYGAGAALESRPVLARLLQECGAAACLAAGFIDGLVEALRAEPLAQLPLGHATTPGLARIVIAQSGRAALRLAAFAPRDAAPAEAVLFEDGEAHEIVLAGTGQAALYRLAAGRLTGESLVCGPGTRMARQGAHEARQIVAVSRPLLVLQLTRTPVRPLPSREYALPDGALVKTISGSKHESQQMMALGVLGALRHAPALAEMERLALDRRAHRDLRWEALRQLLGLDARAGMAVLAQLAGDPRDELCPPAASLRRDLLAAHPQLALPEPA